jgi:hypothetical protein
MTMPLSPETSGTKDVTARFCDIWTEHQNELSDAATPDARADIEKETHDKVRAEFLAFIQGRCLPSNRDELDINK